MDLPTFHQLLTPSGQAALAAATLLEPTYDTFLPAVEKLRKLYPLALAKAAVEMAILRNKAKVKFEAADQMYFTREALEVASGDAAAGHRTARFTPYGTVADLCCGIGGDTLALARAGLEVDAVESDPLRLAMARANAATCGLAERIRFTEGNALAVPLPNARAAFADPSRRSADRRYLDPEAYSPPLSAVRARFPADFPLAVKLAPGVPHRSVEGLDAEMEFVSVGGELKECVAWFGPLRTAGRRATVLPAGATLSSTDAPAPSLPLTGVGAYVFDPDAAVVRAGLAAQLAGELGLRPLDPLVALLTGDEPIVSPFLRAFRVDFAAKFHAGKLRNHLQRSRVGRVTFIKRGSAIDTGAFSKKLKVKGEGHRVVILARLRGEQVMIVGDRL